MERDGLVASRTVAQRRLPPRQVLELTEYGRQVAGTWLAAPGVREEAVLQLAVARVAVPDRFADLAALMADDRAAELSQLRALLRAATPPFQKESIGFEIARCQAEIRWLGSLLDRAGELIAEPLAMVRAGPSGSGKTTLLKLIASLDRPTTVHGRCLARWSVRPDRPNVSVAAACAASPDRSIHTDG